MEYVRKLKYVHMTCIYRISCFNAYSSTLTYMFKMKLILKLHKNCQTILIIIIIINLFIEGSLISAKALFCLRVLFGAMRNHSYTMMASLIRMQTRSRHFRRGNLWVQLYPRMKTFLLVPRRASNHQRTKSWGFNID